MTTCDTCGCAENENDETLERRRIFWIIWKTVRSAEQISLSDSDQVEVWNMRRGVPVPELPEAAMRMGRSYISGPLVGPDGRRKIVCSGRPEHIRAFLESRAPAQGLEDTYGDPERGVRRRVSDRLSDHHPTPVAHGRGLGRGQSVTPTRRAGRHSPPPARRPAMTHYKISTDAQGLRWIAAVDALGEAHDLIMVMPYESVRAAAEDLLAAAGGMISQEDRQALRALAADADQDPALTG